MRFKKATMSVFLIFTFFISTISSGFASAVGVVDYTGGVARMKQLGIVNAAVDSNAMTRGQFAKSVVVASDLVDEASGMRGATIFPDVTSNSELSGYVNVLLNKGLISGMADGKFHGETAVTYQEICSVLVKLLGYVDADLTGTYPTNYISKAKDLKISEDLSYNKADRVTYRSVAVMFDRLLDTDIKSATATVTAKTYSDSINMYTECIVQDDSVSYDKLAKGEVLTDKGVFSLPVNTTKLQVGATYRLKLEDGKITKVYGKVREPVTITANTVVGNAVTYTQDNVEKSMTLPSSITYYYHGVKKDYTSIGLLLKTDSSIIFDNNSKAASSYGVITDPIYSTPELASNLIPNSNTLGGIVFDVNTKILKNDQAISKNDIKDTDVLYSITDVNGNNKYILAVENYIEGNITDIPSDANSLYDIQIDKINYTYSDDLDITKLKSFKEEDLVSIMLDKDDKIVDIKEIENKRGTLAEYVILGNSKTTDDLADNEILTDQGTLTYKSNIGSLDIGGKYKLYVDLSDKEITKIDKKENTIENYVVTEKVGTQMKWENDNDSIVSTEMPKATVYYYHGKKVNNDAAVTAIKAFSSIILSRSSVNNEYEYAVIVDPYFSKPTVYKNGETELFDKITKTKYEYIYRDEQYVTNPNYISNYDVVYFVSDIWNKKCYIYVNVKTLDTFVDAFTPNKLNPTGIVAETETYEFSEYFDKTKLNNYYTGNSIGLIIGVDGKIVDIY